ncbi:MAG TPA: glycine betaine ABC transporter substrate-binding protein, partial [Burkholderiales bacterium]|nr:glycine betaine ABC transporter substrate-binding protein [Burkholderiales bacterium]
MRRWIAAMVTGLIMNGGTARADDNTIVMGQIDISFYAVTAAVVQEVLERLGHRVEVRAGSHGEMFPVLAKGEIDILVAAWLPSGHAVYWEQYGKESVQLATLYRDAQLYWSVPPYVPASLVSGVADLKKPEVAQRMVKVIRGTAPDSGLVIGSRKIMDKYQLDREGYELVPGKRDAWVAHLEENLAAKRWFVMPSFRPNYLNLVADMRMLEEPFKLLGEASDGALVAHRNFVARVPQRTTQVLTRVYLGLDAVAQMDRMVNVDKMSIRDAAHTW